jgi:hypothetical protein
MTSPFDFAEQNEPATAPARGTREKPGNGMGKLVLLGVGAVIILFAFIAGCIVIGISINEDRRNTDEWIREDNHLTERLISAQNKRARWQSEALATERRGFVPEIERTGIKAADDEMRHVNWLLENHRKQRPGR